MARGYTSDQDEKRRDSKNHSTFLPIIWVSPVGLPTPDVVARQMISLALSDVGCQGNVIVDNVI
jgi:hypothetical protein